ncbi:MAG: DUF3108 domain-containing protein [Rhizobiaceae bacterium]|nr:DUF3108 domain-containing protein [Rhizobiaceae bacterium]MCV0407605.1 DUF3108 domain-containing protein [Rhizobiaceae bacterium]
MAKRASIVTGLAVTLVLTALTPQPAPASAEQRFRGDYSVSLWGMTIGRSTFRSSIEGDRFEVKGTVSSAGLAKVFDSTSGAVSVAGRTTGDAVRPTSYRMNYRSGRRSKALEIDFSGERVSRTEITPQPKPRGKNWVALDKGDLARVTDPLSSSLVKAGNLEEVCTKTLRIYDGQSRMDLKLARAGRGPVSVEGYSGDAITCTASFAPRSGYREGDSTVEFLKDRANIRLVFAPLGQTGLYAPVRAAIDTKIGTVTVRAERFGAE